MTRPAQRIAIHVYPSTMSTMSRIDRLSRTLAQLPSLHEVHLVGTPSPSLPSTERLDDGRVVRRIGRRPRRLTGTVARLLHAASWQPLVYREYSGRTLAAVSAHSVFVLPLCFLLAKRTGAALAYNPHELETATPSMTGLKRAVARAIERLLIPRVDVMSVVNRSIAQWYDTEHGTRPLVVYNVPLDLPAGRDLRAEVGLGDADLLYIMTGAQSAGRNIDTIVSAFEKVCEAHVVFLGPPGSVTPLIESAAHRSDHVHLVEPVGPTEVVSMVRQADVALCLIGTQSLSYRLSSPNKLFEALAASVPPLCTEMPEARSWLGPIADELIVPSPEQDLPAVIESTTRETVERLRTRLPTVPAWNVEVAPLVDAYRRLLDRNTRR